MNAPLTLPPQDATPHDATPQQGTPPKAAPAAKAIIRFAQVAKSYPARRGQAPVSALSDISLDVPEGAILGVIGRSGAGKSTLIRLVNGLEKPTAG